MEARHGWASFYYWLSQNLSLAAFSGFVGTSKCCWFTRKCATGFWRLATMPGRIGRTFHLAWTRRKAADARGQNKIYDAVWIGRIHRQKGIEDLLATLSHFVKTHRKFPRDFDWRSPLRTPVANGAARACALCRVFRVCFRGEKLRLFHASCVFLMTSRFEGSPRVVAEALACEVPVIAYDVETYRPLFGELLRYVPCFDLKKFQDEAGQADQ